MKILTVAEGMEIGGCETHIYELTRGLIKRGHEVVLLTSGGRFADALAREGVRVVYAPTKKRTPLALLRCVIVLRGLLREHFDVVHTHTRGMSALVHRLTKIAHTVTVHLDFPVRRLSRRFYHFGDSTLAVSEDIREYLIREYGLGRERIHLTYNGIDTAHFVGAATGEHIVHLSRLDRDRSLCALLLCEVAPAVLREQPSRQIHIFGDGNDMPRVRKMAALANKALGREGVVVHGKAEDIRGALCLGEIFVGVSRALLEGMAAGCAAVVCGNDGYCGIVNEDKLDTLIQSNFCARGCERASARRLAIDLLYLCTHPEARRRCAALCQRVTEAHYARDGMVADAEHAYRFAIQSTYASCLLVGYFGEGNFGDEIAKGELISLLEGSRLYVTGKGDAQDGVRYVSRVLGVLRALPRVRCVIFGGGTLFQNETSHRSLLYYCALARMSCALGREVMMLGGGIDTVKGRLARKVTRRALRSFSLLMLRTRGDIESARALGIEDRCFLFPDITLLIRERERKKVRHCVIVCKGTELEEETVALCQRLKTVGYRVTLAALFEKEDLALCHRIGARTGASVCVIKGEKDMLRTLSPCDFVISMRLHGAIAALLAHTLCFLYCGREKHRKLLSDVAQAARTLSVKAPLFPFFSLSEIDTEKILWAKKEAAGKSYGFGKIISYYRGKILEGIKLLQQRELPWEPSSCLREQRHPQEPLLPWTFHERPQEPRAQARW